MTTPSRAVLLEVRAYAADNNVRRALASFSINYGSVSEAIGLQSFNLAPAAVRTIVSPEALCTATLIRTSQPLDVVFTFRDSSTFSTRVMKMIFLDSDVASVAVTAVSLNDADAKVTILQG